MAARGAWSKEQVTNKINYYCNNCKKNMLYTIIKSNKYHYPYCHNYLIEK